jgi:hypothetical protein
VAPLRLPDVLRPNDHRLGESGCRTGRHIDWPAEGRYVAYISTESTNEPQKVIYDDTRPVTELAARRG